MEDIKQSDGITFQKTAVNIAQALGLLNCSISISRSAIATHVIFQLGPLKKIWYSSAVDLSGSPNRTATIKEFLEEASRRFPIYQLPGYNLGIDGSGILVRILKVKKTPGTPLENSILWEIKRSLPFALSQSHFSYRIISKETAYTRVLIAILKKDFLNDLIDLLGDAGISIYEIKVTSLQLAATVRKKNSVLIYQATDYGFIAVRENNKLVYFNIIHDIDSRKTGETLQKTWLKLLEANHSYRKFTMNRFQPVGLKWLPGGDAVEYSELTGHTNETSSLPDHVLNELYSLSAISSYSPELLPVESGKKIIRKKIFWKVFAFLVLFQFLTPGIYYSIRKKSIHLLRNTSYSTILNDINITGKKFQEIENAKKELRILAKIIYKSTRVHSVFLRSLAEISRPRMVLSRVKASSTGRKETLLIEGYSLNVETIADFMEDLEKELPSGSLALETNKKGDTISFSMKWSMVNPARKNANRKEANN